MRHITVRRTPYGMVELDLTRDAEALLDRLAELHGTDPTIVDDLLGALGSALAFRDRSRQEDDDTRATLAAAQADAARDELVARMAAVHADGMRPVVAELARQDAVALARELTAAASPHPVQSVRGAA
ncbi:hypothetical protein ACGFWI_00960 [Streptomyces sp. NPDC048434]|uniref:hypothetical protein n=1 Tax=Streptomyces sp. NPDC048434 TaxID=3365549 RepID=UPI003721E8E6